MKKCIVYIGSFSFPFGDAVAKRAHGLARSFAAAGYEVKLIGESADVPLGCVSEEENICGFALCNIHKPASAKEHYFYRSDVSLIEKKIREWNKDSQITAVIFCGTKCSLLANALTSMCRRLRIPSVADSMDWLSSRTGNIFFDFIKQSDITFELTYVNKKSDAVIAISKYLQGYYQKCGKKTILIPPLSPYDRMNVCDEPEDVPTLVYAGVPCRLDRPLRSPADAKDRLDIALQLFHRAHREEIPFRFLIFGMTSEQYLTAFPAQSAIVQELLDTQKVSFLGRVPSEVVKTAVSEADFTILLREKNRTSMAGYPTKISESIALGTPVITTDTSDICEHIRDGFDSAVLEIDDFECAYLRFAELLCATKEQRRYMKQNAATNCSYSPEMYSERLYDFIETL